MSNLDLIVIQIMLLNLIFSLIVIRKSGFSGWWSILASIPIFSTILLWIFAYVEWPSYPNLTVADKVKAKVKERLNQGRRGKKATHPSTGPTDKVVKSQEQENLNNPIDTEK